MSFKILPTPAFARELKKLAKKYSSIKSDLSSLVISLAKHPSEGVALGNNFLRSEWLYPQKIKESQVEQELSRILKSLMKRFTWYLYMINQKVTQLQMTNC